jgi:hypothetical protein
MCVLFSALGVKRHRDLGKNFESGAYKRKIKAHIDQKILELCRPLLTFLKINDDVTVRNKDLGVNQ